MSLRSSKMVWVPSACFAAPLIALLSLASGCSAPTPAVEEAVKPTELNVQAPLTPKSDGEEAATEDTIDHVIASVDTQTVGEDAEEADENVGDEISHATTEKIPMEINAEVERWIDFFTVKDRERMQRFLERGERYRPMISAVLKEQGIPTEIYYQAMIESGFATHATSRAKAVGVWQFIKETGKRYGLRVDAYVDERRDPMRATIAASLYLKDLHNVFQSWYLAMASYNAGESRIMSAIMRAKTRDFWEMVKTRALPQETMAYIPKFLAATIIGHDPQKYGFDELSPEMMPTLVSVNVPSPVKLSDIAQVSGVPLESLKDYNPHLLRGVTPPGVSTYRVWIPKDQAEGADEWSTKLVGMRLKGLKQITSTADNAQPKYHRVVVGDTLVRVAGMYGIPASQIKKLNHLRSSRLTPGTKLTLWTAEPTSLSFKRYKVQRGDNLDNIARRFNVSVDEIKKINRLKRSKIYVGQVLKVGSQKG